MKKISALFIAGLITLCFSMGINAQSSEKELDQAELMKQLLGTWKVELGVDTTLTWEIIPFGKGYEFTSTWKAKGKSYATAKAISGFTWENQQVNMYWLMENGMISRDLGEFVSEKKLVMERFNAKHTNIMFKWEMDFLTPDKNIVKSISKGNSDTWDDPVVTEFTWIREK